MNSILLLVLGMHRSGTSAAAKALEVLGANMGEHLMPGAADNPLGFFEDQQLQHLNEGWLAQQGLAWDSVTASAEATVQPDLIEAQREVIGQRLRDRLEMPLWAFKDPRMCRLFWLWQPALRELSVDTRCVFVLREPFAVAQSLLRRNGMPLAQGLLLWRLHNVEAFSAFQGMRGGHLFYEDLLSNPMVELPRLARDLGLDAPDARRLRAYCDEFLSRGLNHFEAEASREHLPADLHAFYAALWKRLRGAPSLLKAGAAHNPFGVAAPHEAQLLESCLYVEQRLIDMRKHANNLAHALDVSQAAHSALSEAYAALQTATSTPSPVPGQQEHESVAAPDAAVAPPEAQAEDSLADAAPGNETILKMAMMRQRQRIAELESRLYRQQIKPYKRTT